MGRNKEKWLESYTPPREDKYDYRDFLAEDNPEAVVVAQQIQAQSYVNMGFVRPEGIVTLPGGEQILASDITNPAEEKSIDSTRYWTEYSIGLKKNSNDINPITGEMVVWKKRFAPLEALPTYIYCKDYLWPGWDEYLREVERDPYSRLAEPEALGKTVNAGKGVIIEFMRNEIQRAYGQNEVWFMGLVERTVFNAFVRNWGPLAVEQIGDPKSLNHPLISQDVKLVPTVMNIDTFYVSYYHYLKALKTTGELTKVEEDHFVYMSEGISDARLGRKVAKFRDKIVRNRQKNYG